MEETERQAMTSSEEEVVERGCSNAAPLKDLPLSYILNYGGEWTSLSRRGTKMALALGSLNPEIPEMSSHQIRSAKFKTCNHSTQ